MTLVEQPPASPPARKRGGNRAPAITGKVRAALDAMVWDGLPRKEAAEKAGITEHGLYKALRRPPVRAAYLSELDVLRTSERARNIHALVDVRDQTGNAMARVNAVKALEQLDNEPNAAAARVSSPGLVIQIISAPAASPLLSNQRDSAETVTISTTGAPFGGEREP